MTVMSRLQALLTWRGGVADLVLAANDGPVGHFSAQGDALLCTDGWQHKGAFRDPCHPAEKEDRGFQGPEEEPRAREEEVACMQHGPLTAACSGVARAATVHMAGCRIEALDSRHPATNESGLRRLEKELRVHDMQLGCISI